MESTGSRIVSPKYDVCSTKCYFKLQQKNAMLCVIRAQSHIRSKYSLFAEAKNKAHCFQKKEIKPFEGLYNVIKKDRVIINATKNLKI